VAFHDIWIFTGRVLVWKQQKQKNSFHFNMTEKSMAAGLGEVASFSSQQSLPSSQADHGKWNLHRRTYLLSGLKKHANLAPCPPRPIPIPIQHPENHHRYRRSSMLHSDAIMTKIKKA